MGISESPVTARSSIFRSQSSVRYYFVFHFKKQWGQTEPSLRTSQCSAESPRPVGVQLASPYSSCRCTQHLNEVSSGLATELLVRWRALMLMCGNIFSSVVKSRENSLWIMRLCAVFLSSFLLTNQDLIPEDFIAFFAISVIMPLRDSG